MADQPAVAYVLIHILLSGCCIPCTGEMFRSLVQAFPGISWLDLVAELDSNAEVLTYLDNPQEYEP